MTNDAPDRFGEARQRTDLAWSRTGLAIALVVLVVLRHLPSSVGHDALVVLALLAGGLTTWAVGLWIAHRVSPRDRAVQPTLGLATLRLVTIGTVLVAAAAFVVAVLPLP